MAPHNILTIKLRYLGDVLLATPTWQALKAAYPRAKLTAIVNRGTEDILLSNPHVDEVLSLERGSLVQQYRFIASIRRRGFDTVVDLTDGDRAALLTWMSGARVRIGFNAEHRWTGRCYTRVITSDAGAHRIERDLSAHAPLSERQSLLKIADDSNPGHLPAIDTKCSLVFVRSTTDVKNRAHQ